jgi:hypothetical protein
MEDRSQKILTSLMKYYSDHEKLNLMQRIISAQSSSNKMSLRLVDWLVTNYSKSHNVVYYVNKMPFNMHQSYKNMLRAYSKKLFDPFRRHKRVYLNGGDTQSNTIGVVETTVAQLTFFKWAIENDVLKYAYENRKLIKEDMDKNTRFRHDESAGAQQKRKEMYKTTKKANMYSVNICVTFS